MTVFDISKPILLKIIQNDIPFALALRNAFKKESDPVMKSNVQALIGCELRHHLLFEDLINRYVENTPIENTINLRFYLANNLFLKRFSDDELLKLVYTDINKETVDPLLDFVRNTEHLIDENLDKASPKFLSLRFNTPEWIIKMWQKQYGKGLVFKLLKANYHQPLPCLRIDTNKIDKQKFLANHQDFVESQVPDVLVYQNKGTPKNLEEFKNCSIFFLKMSTKYVLDKLEYDRFKKIVIYSGTQNNIYLDMVARLSDTLDLEIVTSHTQNYFETKKNIENLNLKGINIYNAEASSIITCISNPVDNVICVPNSSALNLLRNTPDYFLRVKQENLDSFIAGEKEALEECARVVNDNGILTYMVPTLCKKETINVIGDFLSEHPEYTLLEDRQFFPFENYDSCLYYAILKKAGLPSD